MIGIVNGNMIAVDQIGRKNHQIGATGMAQRWEQDTAKSGCDDQVCEFPRRRDFLVDASDLAPGTIPLLPGVTPDVWIISLRQVGDFGECDPVGGKGGRRCDVGACLYSSSAVWAERDR